MNNLKNTIAQLEELKQDLIERDYIPYTIYEYWNIIDEAGLLNEYSLLNISLYNIINIDEFEIGEDMFILCDDGKTAREIQFIDMINILNYVIGELEEMEKPNNDK